VATKTAAGTTKTKSKDLTPAKPAAKAAAGKALTTKGAAARAPATKGGAAKSGGGMKAKGK
jgi:hypothetical protein